MTKQTRCVLLAAITLSPGAVARGEERQRLEEVVVQAEKPGPAASSEDIPARELELQPHSTA